MIKEYNLYLRNSSEVVYEGVVKVRRANCIEAVGVRSHKSFNLRELNYHLTGPKNEWELISVETLDGSLKGYLNELINPYYTDYDNRWIQPGSSWWHDTDFGWVEMKITHRRGKCIFYRTPNDPEEHWFHCDSPMARLAVPKKFYLNKFYEDCRWSFSTIPHDLSVKLCEFIYVDKRSDIDDKAYEYCYQKLVTDETHNLELPSY